MGSEAEKPAPQVFLSQPVADVASLQAVRELETTQDLLGVNVFHTGDTALDHEIHNFHKWAERQLHQPVSLYLAQSKFGAVVHADELRAAENQAAMALYKQTFDSFFWTGIECSNPESPEGERWDQLELAGVYDPAHRRKQIEQMVAMGIYNIRLGMPNHRMVEDNDWECFDEILADFRAHHVKVSLDLQHFGLPAEYRNDENPEESIYLNPAWPEHYVAFAMETVKRYLPDLEAVTLINEPLITNRFSGVVWNEAMPGSFKDPMYNYYFIKRALLIAKAAVKARMEIEAYLREQGRQLVFIHNESCEYQPDNYDFNTFNRFLASDLILGQDWLLADDYQSTDMFKWLARHYVRQSHLTEDIGKLVAELEAIREMHFSFRIQYNKTMKADTVFGVDYYMGCESVQPGFHYELSKTCVKTYEQEVVSGKRRGLTRICIEYWNRYQLPILHTETNFYKGCEDWGIKQLVELAQVQKFGIPILGFNWYSLMDQFNWDDAMKGSPQDVRLHPVGLLSWPGYQARQFTRTVLPDLMQALAQPV